MSLEGIKFYINENIITFSHEFKLDNTLQKPLHIALCNKINNLGISCNPDNIKLFDIEKDLEIHSFDDIINCNTQKCKIIIKPIICNKHKLL